MTKCMPSTRPDEKVLLGVYVPNDFSIAPESIGETELNCYVILVFSAFSTNSFPFQNENKSSRF